MYNLAVCGADSGFVTFELEFKKPGMPHVESPWDTNWDGRRVLEGNAVGMPIFRHSPRFKASFPVCAADLIK
jgi:hypothetical protein